MKTPEQSIRVERRGRRVLRSAKKIRGTAEMPRLAIFRSHRHFGAQLINDDLGQTLASFSSQNKEFRGKFKHGGNIAAAKEIGKQVAELAKQKGITKVCFDKRWYRYHGRVKAFADAARAAGMKF